MKSLNLKASHKPVKDYYEVLNDLNERKLSHEGAVSPAFAALLRHCGAQFGQTLVEKFPFKYGTHNLIIDGAMADRFNLVHGYWEAKDSSDDLDKEIKKKFAIGYPKDNILFQAPNRIVIYQDSRSVFDNDIANPEALIEALRIFLEYEAPAYAEWERAADEFKLKVKELATGLLELIEKERKTNTAFVQAFDDFVELCQETINPEISVPAVEEMLIQHLLTERIFRKVFNNPDFAERNVIAHEVEKVITALTSHSFSRAEFLRPLDRFYGAIESTAATIEDFSQKQHFLNTVYERFFQGFSVKVADTHGIVYTPQPIVKFMVKSVEHILKTEFSRSLSDEGVHIIDPFVGTGNFILSVMREIRRSQLPFKYANELHCNEVMLLPYYIASMNIEHAYFESTGEYKPFEGICLVDTFETSKHQASMFVRANTARVRRQQNSPIFVVIGNPPYNAGQVNENDNNKNRKYPALDSKIAITYGKGSNATLLRKLYDPYIKAIRWASDRIGEEGVVALVTNRSFIESKTFDAMRRCLEQDFHSIYLLDLGGNSRTNHEISNSNVFGIQPGVSINLFIKKKLLEPRKAIIRYFQINDNLNKNEKLDILNERGNVDTIQWDEIHPDTKYNWLTRGIDVSFDAFLPLGTKEAKISRQTNVESIFKKYSIGLSTNRDSVVYDFNKNTLEHRLVQFYENYKTELARFQTKEKPPEIDSFVDYEKIKWSSTLKNHLKYSETGNFRQEKITTALYRPFTTSFLYYDSVLIDRPGLFKDIFPLSLGNENTMICVNQSMERPFTVLASDFMADLHMCGGFGTGTQCFPFYTYTQDGNNRSENITDWALNQYQTQYKDDKITKKDIFNYVYGLLHSPVYREKFEANLKRELPHIPFAPDFWSFANAGKQLADLHVNYETQPEYKLTWIEEESAKVHYRVDKMVLAKDKTKIKYNDFLTLAGIPPEVFEYRLGNRSALEWIIDQYQVSPNKRSGITNDPNRADDPQYIVHLIGKIITVSLATIKLVKSLPQIN